MQLLHRQLESGSKSLVVAAIVRLATSVGLLVISDGWLVGAVGVPVGASVGSNSGKSVGISDG